MKITEVTVLTDVHYQGNAYRRTHYKSIFGTEIIYWHLMHAKRKTDSARMKAVPPSTHAELENQFNQIKNKEVKI